MHAPRIIVLRGNIRTPLRYLQRYSAGRRRHTRDPASDGFFERRRGGRSLRCKYAPRSPEWLSILASVSPRHTLLNFAQRAMKATGGNGPFASYTTVTIAAGMSNGPRLVRQPASVSSVYAPDPNVDLFLRFESSRQMTIRTIPQSIDGRVGAGTSAPERGSLIVVYVHRSLAKRLEIGELATVR
jgi:hypothetical protein